MTWLSIVMCRSDREPASHTLAERRSRRRAGVSRSCVTERKVRALKPQRGDVPVYAAKEILTREGADLLLPVSEADALKEVRVRHNGCDALGSRAN